MRHAAVALAVVAAAALAVTGCGGSNPAGAPDGTVGSTAPRHTSLAVYFLREGKVSPVRRTIDPTQGMARAALTALLAGPTAAEKAAGLETALPAGCSLEGLEVADGTATVDLAGIDTAVEGERRREQVAQIVTTLTRFPTVDRVSFVGSGLSVGGSSWDRLAIEDQLPQILVESPLPGDQVTSPVRTHGTANVFEATVSFEVRDAAGRVVLRSFTTASSGTGTRGTFDTELPVPTTDGPVTIIAFEASAEDGSRLHVARVPVAVSD